MLEAITQHDPVDGAAIGFRAHLTQVPDQFGVKARLFDLKAFGVDLPDQVEIDEAVVHRRDERVGKRDRRARQRIVAAGRIDDDEVGILAEACDRRLQTVRRQQRQHFVLHHRQSDVAPTHRRGAVLEVARKCTLARIEVECGDAVAGGGKRDRHVHCRGRLAGPALFVREHDTVRAR